MSHEPYKSLSDSDLDGYKLRLGLHFAEWPITPSCILRHGPKPHPGGHFPGKPSANPHSACLSRTLSETLSEHMADKVSDEVRDKDAECGFAEGLLFLSALTQ
jgi:hypothetical protein